METNTPRSCISGWFIGIAILMIGICAVSICKIHSRLDRNNKVIIQRYDSLSHLHSDKIIAMYRHDTLVYPINIHAIASADTSAIRYESALLSSEIKQLLTIYTNTVSASHNSIILWASVITLLFLVFSFFGLFKIEETLRQCSDKKNELEKNYEDFQKKLNVEKADFKKFVDYSSTLSNIKLFISLQQYESAIYTAQQLILKLKDITDEEISEILATAYAYKGEAYGDMGNRIKQNGGRVWPDCYQRAIDAYNAAIKITPNDAALYNNLASVYWGLGEYDQVYQKYLESEKLYGKNEYETNPTLFVNVAETLYYLAQSDLYSKVDFGTRKDCLDKAVEYIGKAKEKAKENDIPVDGRISEVAQKIHAAITEMQQASGQQPAPENS